MLQILRIKEIYPIMYNNIPYPVIKTEAIVDDNEKAQTEIFGTESMEKQMFYQDGTPKTEEAKEIDEKIYAYVPDEILKKSELEIRDWIERNLD